MFISCKDNGGVCEKSGKATCCIDCAFLEECEGIGCICTVLRLSRTKAEILVDCLFSEGVEG